MLLSKSILTDNHLLPQMNTNQSTKLSLAFYLPYNRQKYKKLPSPHILQISKHRDLPNRETPHV